MAKRSKAIIIYLTNKKTGTKFPVCSKCNVPLNCVKIDASFIKYAIFEHANYCPYCGSKFIKRGKNNV